MDNPEIKRSHGRMLAGLFLLAIGSVLFLRQTGFPLPEWLFTWPVILIVVGLFVGLKSGFRGIAWIILLIVGTVNLFDFMQGSFSLQRYTAPFIILALGLFLILRPNKFRHGRFGQWQNRNQWEHPQGTEQPYEALPVETLRMNDADPNEMNYIDSVAVFGSVRKVVLSKNFKGGEAMAILGGNEIDLRQADINGFVTLEVTQILGGTKILLPAHWDVKSEMVAFFGGIEDKRQLSAGINDPSKVLVLRGTSVFGGIEIRNY